MPKQLTPEQQKAFDLWFWGEDRKGGFWAFWRSLSDLHNNAPGTRQEGYDACKKLSLADLKEMEDKTRELVKWDRHRKKKGEFVEQYKHLCRWVSKGAYERYTGSYGVEDEEPKSHKCLWCNNEVKIKFTLCEEHANWYRENYGPSREERLKWFKKQGIVKEGMTKTEVMKAYRKSRDESLRKITQRVLKK